MRRSFILCCILPGTFALADLPACSNGTSGTGPDVSSDASTDGSSSDVTLPPEGGEDQASPPDGGDAAIHDATVQDGEARADTGTGSGGEASADTGTDSGGDAAVDAGADSGPDGAEEAGCSGVVCNGQCTSASDCHGCPGAPLLCAPSGQCTGDCQGCTDSNDGGLPIQCFACDSNHQNPIGTCQYNDAGSYCLNGNYLGQYDGGPGYRCGCTDVSECPGATQACVPLGGVGGSFCLTCGETTLGAIQGAPCRDGGTCQESLAACQ